MTIKPVFAWYDFWVGIFWDRRKRVLYVLPVPMLGVKFCFAYKPAPETDCPLCHGTGEESSGVCHCGAEMEGHSLYDNHSATEMTRPCECLSKAKL